MERTKIREFTMESSDLKSVMTRLQSLVIEYGVNEVYAVALRAYMTSLIKSECPKETFLEFLSTAWDDYEKRVREL